MPRFPSLASALLIGLVLAPSAFAAGKPATPRFVGRWVLHLYIGDRVFDDDVVVAPGTDGRLGGGLTVPGRFTAPLAGVVADRERFRFEITADEGRGPFTVRYDGTFHPDTDAFVGFATLVPQNELLGAF